MAGSSDLLDDIIFEILKNLPIKNILDLCCTSKQFNRVCKNDHFWELIVKRDFGNVKKSLMDWKQTYKEIFERKKYDVFIHGNPDYIDKDALNPSIMKKLQKKYNEALLNTDIAVFEALKKYYKEREEEDIIFWFLEDQQKPKKELKKEIKSFIADFGGFKYIPFGNFEIDKELIKRIYKKDKKTKVELAYLSEMISMIFFSD